MPIYQYRCNACGEEFEESQRINDPIPECIECESEDVTRLITGAPHHSKGIHTHAGTARRSSKAELQDKWREETPKLRKKIRDKLGEDAVKDIPSLNFDYGDD